MEFPWSTQALCVKEAGYPEVFLKKSEMVLKQHQTSPMVLFLGREAKRNLGQRISTKSLANAQREVQDLLGQWKSSGLEATFKALHHDCSQQWPKTWVPADAMPAPLEFKELAHPAPAGSQPTTTTRESQ